MWYHENFHLKQNVVLQKKKEKRKEKKREKKEGIKFSSALNERVWKRFHVKRQKRIEYLFNLKI